MSADNFYVVHGNKVWCGFLSDQPARWRNARDELRWYRRLLRSRPVFVGADRAEAEQWAHTEYAEYGVFALPPGLAAAREGEPR